MDWYVADKAYAEYLETIDSKVGFIDYGSKIKLHVGIIHNINGFKYYVPISSCKPKHLNMSNNIDFHKIQDPTTGFIYAVLNINNMIPVPDKYIVQLKYNEIEKYRPFSCEKEKIDYIYLLQLEKSIIDSIEAVITNKATSLYNKFMNNPNSNLSKRCCNFQRLEVTCKEYEAYSIKVTEYADEAAVSKE